MSDLCPLCRQPLPAKLKGLPGAASPDLVGLAQAVIERDQHRRSVGRFHALGHLNGRRYEDWIDFDGRAVRFWGDGETERSPLAPTPAA
jgi:hypothetical protein